MKSFDEFTNSRLDERSVSPSSLQGHFEDIEDLVKETKADLATAIRLLTKEDHTDVTSLIKRRIDSTVRSIESLQSAVKLPLRFKEDSVAADED